jgi:hypothetical protein
MDFLVVHMAEELDGRGGVLALRDLVACPLDEEMVALPLPRHSAFIPLGNTARTIAGALSRFLALALTGTIRLLCLCTTDSGD